MDKTFLNITKIRVEQKKIKDSIIIINQGIADNNLQAKQLQKQLRKESEQLRQLQDIEKRVSDL